VLFLRSDRFGIGGRMAGRIGCGLERVVADTAQGLDEGFLLAVAVLTRSCL